MHALYRTRRFAQEGVRILSLLVCVILLLGCATKGSQSDPQIGTQVGQLAPGFELEDLEGSKIKLSDYRGRVVLINFWATWCSYCRTEFPEIQRAYEGNDDKDFVVLAVNVQERKASVQAYVEELGLTFPVLLDPLGRASVPYKARGLPTSYFVDQRGIVMLRKVGPVDESTIQHVLAQAGVE